LIRQFGALDPAAVRREQLEEIVAAYTDLHALHGGVIRAWAERAAPPDSPLKEDAARTFEALLHEMARAIAGVRAPGATRSDVRAALLFLLIEQSAQYLSNRHSRTDPARLAPTLSTMLHRAWFGGPAPGRPASVVSPVLSRSESQSRG
jgi:hypothetical protein